MTPTLTHPAARRPARDLAVGDRIAAGFLPTGEPADVAFVLPYAGHRNDWVFVVVLPEGGRPEGMPLLADACIPLAAPERATS